MCKKKKQMKREKKKSGARCYWAVVKEIPFRIKHVSEIGSGIVMECMDVIKLRKSTHSYKSPLKDEQMVIYEPC